AYYGRNRRGNFAIIFPSLISKNLKGSVFHLGIVCTHSAPTQRYFCRRVDGTIEAREKRSAFDAGAYGRYPAADSGAFRTRFAALVDRNPHHAGADLRAVGPDSPQSCLGAARDSSRAGILATIVLRADFPGAVVQYLFAHAEADSEFHSPCPDPRTGAERAPVKPFADRSSVAAYKSSSCQ